MENANPVVPSEQDLKIESDGCVCTVEGCGRLFQASSQLQMHLTKHHQGKQLSAKTGSHVYYCPAENCERNLSNGKPFPRLGQLKQHYQRIHGTKSHSCRKCGKQFSLKDAHSRHEAECGRTFKCESCGEELKTRNALYKHAQRRGHTLPEGSKVRERKKVPTPPTPQPVFPRPIVVKQVVRLTRLVSSSTQTEWKDHGNTFDSRTEVISQSFQESVPGCAVGPLSSSILLDLSTQTDPCLNLEQTFDLNDLATQTDFTGFFDFGTQTTSQYTSSQSCQTAVRDHTHTQSCQTYVIPEFGRTMDLCSVPTSGPVNDMQGYGIMETNPDDLLVEFGTQTVPPDTNLLVTSQMTPDDLLVEFGTQTLPPHTQSTPMTSDDLLVEFGTQTLPPNAQPHQMTSDDLLVEFGTQTFPPDAQPHQMTSDDLLVEFGTQTSRTNICSQAAQQIPAHQDTLVEFGTQTCLPDSQQLLGMATQTEEEDFYDHLTSLQPRTDFGTQTIDELFLEMGSFFSSSTNCGGELESRGAGVSYSTTDPPVGGLDFGVQVGLFDEGHTTVAGLEQEKNV